MVDAYIIEDYIIEPPPFRSAAQMNMPREWRNWFYAVYLALGKNKKYVSDIESLSNAIPNDGELARLTHYVETILDDSTTDIELPGGYQSQSVLAMVNHTPRVPDIDYEEIQNDDGTYSIIRFNEALPYDSTGTRTSRVHMLYWRPVST